MERLARQGFLPQLIFDVGAYHGEYAELCRRVWPQSFIACVEPQADAAALLRTKVDSRMAVYDVLLGAEEQSAVAFYEVGTGSSVLMEYENKSHPVVFHPMRTVDEILTADFEGYVLDLLKLDVQGFELEVLKGSERALSRVQVILAEMNLLDIHESVPLLGEVTAWLRERDFVAFDICGLTRRPLDEALWQADLLFVPVNSPLRSDKRWAA